MATASKAKKQVTVYNWFGKDKNGKNKKGEIPAANEQLVRAYLQKQSITPTRVVEKPKPLYESKGKIKTKHITSFTRQMTTMLKAGMSVTKSLSLIAAGISRPIRLREMIDDIQAEVEAGSSFSGAISKYPVYFNGLYVSLVSAGEEAGVLDETMERIAVNFEKSETTRKKVRKALVYPIIIILVAIGISIVLLVKVIPIFESFFSDFGAKLPWLTIQVVNVSHYLRSYGLYILAAIVFAIWLFIYVKKRNRSFQRKVNRFAFKIPVIGGILKLGANARFSRTLSVLFDSGVPLVKGLDATAPATGSVIYEEATHEIASDVSNGAQLNFAMQNSGKFEPFAVQMVGIGEESGNLGQMLGNVASFYEEELDYKVDNLTTILEPLIICIVAVIVGTLVIAMYMPIFVLGDVVK